MRAVTAAHFSPGDRVAVRGYGSEALCADLRGLGFPCAPGESASAPRSFELAVSVCELHARSATDRLLLLEEMRRLAPAMLLIDWQLPERNLHLPAFWLTKAICRPFFDAGLRQRFRDYEQAGALEGVLHLLRNRFSLQARHDFLGGSMAGALGTWREGEFPLPDASGIFCQNTGSEEIGA